MRTFSLNEAQAMLPVLESLLRASIEAKQKIEEIEAELQHVQERIFLDGGVLLDVKRWARRSTERDKALRKAKDSIAEISAIGVQVKDLEMGLLDFPCKVESGEIVLLCWKLGEDGDHSLAWSGRRLRRAKTDRRAHPAGQARSDQLM